LNLAATRIDYAPFSGHKLYAPKGIGMLYVRAGAPFTPLMMGGGQESGLRSGTENMAGIAALGAVLALLEDGAAFRDHATLSGYRARLADSLRDALPGVVFNMPFAGSLPTTLNFSVPDLSSKELLDLFDAAGVRVSAGSACSAAKSAPSYVLEAMGLPEWRSGAAVRLSYGPAIDEAEVNAACERIARCGAALRSSGLISPDPRPATDAVTRLEADGACGWLITDADSGGCVLIDPPPAFIARLVETIRSQDLRVRAVLHTGQPGDEGAAWLAALGQVLQPADTGAGAGIALGAHTLARLAHAGGTVYLLGSAEQIAAGQPRFAFTGTLDATALGDAAIGPDTLLCGGTDDGVVCTVLGKKELQAGLASLLAAAELDDFFDRHPDALLVDVREAHEHAAAGAPLRLGGKTARSVPLSQLAGSVEQWLAVPSLPLVFVCRSGNRSGKAVASLRALGHASAWHLAGGIAAL
jgi:rhodanese-related sulfurtransferase